MPSGRVQCILIGTKNLEVVYERFYEVFTEVEKSQIRLAFAETVADEPLTPNSELIGRLRNGHIVAIPYGELVFFSLGTGEYNELALSELLRVIINTYIDVHKNQTLNDDILFQNWAQTIMVIDEVCKEGHVEHLDREGLRKALAFKVPKYTNENVKVRGSLRSMVSYS